MTTYTKHVLSGSTNGRPIAVTNTAATGTTIHTAPTGTTGYDEVYLWATNLSTVTTPSRITIEFGGTSGSDNIPYDTYAGDCILVVPGIPLNNELIVKAFATASTLFNVFGYVNRIAT